MPTIELIVGIFIWGGVEMEKAERVLRKPEVFNKVSLSDPTIYRLEQLGKFPGRIKLGGKAVGWLESEVDEWLQKKADAREKPSGSENKMECR